MCWFWYWIVVSEIFHRYLGFQFVSRIIIFVKTFALLSLYLSMHVGDSVPDARPDAAEEVKDPSDRDWWLNKCKAFL